MTEIAVIDYGMGNLRSVAQALSHVAEGRSVAITSDADVIAKAKYVVFPGQGAMPDCVRELDARGLRQTVLDAAANKPFLGICIGLQLLFEHSEEGDVAGLAVFKGRVKRFASPLKDAQGNKLKVPHMGWNQVHQEKPHPLWQGIAQDARFYYVHSYYVVPDDVGILVGSSEYPTKFTCAVARDNIFAVQFHPEKSQHAGLQLLKNFIHWDGNP
ncbi:MAG: imidazole glycerol phosphate synthase subunit HisH [Methylophilaceae bacterium]